MKSTVFRTVGSNPTLSATCHTNLSPTQSKKKFEHRTRPSIGGNK